MTWLQAVVLGTIQGMTEFLPISSSGHLVLVQKLWHIQGNHLLFVSLLHLGTLVAVVWAFRAEVRLLLRHPFSWQGRMLMLACIPTALVGAAFEDLFANLFATGTTVGLEFVITGTILWWIDSVTAGNKTVDDMTAADAMWVGLLQGAAILPALSRSGLTIAGGLWRGFNRDTAARFSFLLSIPAILGATAIELDNAWDSPIQGANDWPMMLLGAAAAVIAGYLSIHGTMWLIRRAKMRIFAIYAFAIAAFVLIDQFWFHVWFPPLFG